MATIRDLLQRDLVIDNIESTDKSGVIREFAGLLKSTSRITDEEELVRVLLEREALGSTGIGDGVAIPHAKLHMISEMIVAFGRSEQGVEYESMDAQPVHLFFLLVTPDDKPGEHLRALARISRILKNPLLREQLRQVNGREDILKLLYEEDGRYPQPQNLQR
ncbi:MAG TPA: fructose PTS transporter subunit IIA [Nitrospirota bacterium]